ncbi:hypothetical protein B0T14DRAFT_249738 [Immersiella caudata]|uniref:Uncharacterized protein n=1 Tax=Immersiella caudata TaxID=314043 RepID=A0AA39WJI3_9PEZI|nr:hypothetical protein B0T14DRAFT_249738 [Immersiella caudata]
MPYPSRRRQSTFLALSLLSTIPALASAYHLLPRQVDLPNFTICTCSSKVKGTSSVEGVCAAAGGQYVLITAVAEENGKNAGIPQTHPGWNTCYIRGDPSDRIAAAFSDTNCAEKFGEGFTSDCVRYPNTPGLANVPFGPPPYCQQGREAVPDCPVQGCSNWFAYPACCRSIEKICLGSD